MKSLALTALAISLPLTQAVELATEQATKYAYCNLSNEKIKIRVTARTIGTTTTLYRGGFDGIPDTLYRA